MARYMLAMKTIVLWITWMDFFELTFDVFVNAIESKKILSTGGYDRITYEMIRTLSDVSKRSESHTNYSYSQTWEGSWID